ncbi:6-hydroxymethylpterin diphosphokinase MptE-like protein [Gracilinema caldarium]|uniref:6-hydroxymethylpterin diphosphokinase MptE-like domain-containing protein n=1 Tax=Gracilinema caldarium (strain ATCC 51460 / DSM 7334 / H1) TaxID=744872 RepID=F8F2P5_GRAC1|nr:6-hydroxymethylpterin diphosphokinase MptE-like protein [Gracilinema caldarium]AEJ19439.1 protein of unknown function DUF115 [Gracilinema caldarium DSM 7334]
MIPRLVPSRLGQPTMLVGNNLIHSSYNPLYEAERFVKALNIPHNCENLIILEPGLGYCIPFIKKSFPNKRILVIHAINFLKHVSESFDDEAHKVWFPEGDIDLLDFLEQEIPEGSHSFLIEWKPSAVAFGQQYQNLWNIVQQFIKREAANIRTTEGFGKRWIKNSIKNLARLQNPLYFNAGTIPVIVTGAGPSLEETIPLIYKTLQEGPACIIAAASSVPALLYHHIIPSLSVATDGGTWATFHLIDQSRRVRLFPAFSSSKAEGMNVLPFPLATSLNAYLSSHVAQVPQLVISDGSIWQTKLLQKLEVPYIQLPQRGTVSATIIDIAMALTSGPIYITGMDMAHRDMMTHARPYGLDFYYDQKVNRFSPLYHLQFKRALIDANYEALSIYADWFNWYFSDKTERIFVIGTKHPRFPMLTAVERISWQSYEAPSFYILPRKNGNIQQRIQSLLLLLIQELQTSPEHELMRKELSFLLTGDKEALSSSEIIQQVSNLFSQGVIHG